MEFMEGKELEKVILELYEKDELEEVEVMDVLDGQDVIIKYMGKYYAIAYSPYEPLSFIGEVKQAVVRIKKWVPANYVERESL